MNTLFRLALLAGAAYAVNRYLQSGRSPLLSEGWRSHRRDADHDEDQHAAQQDQALSALGGTAPQGEWRRTSEGQPS